MSHQKNMYARNDAHKQQHILGKPRFSELVESEHNILSTRHLVFHSLFVDCLNVSFNILFIYFLYVFNGEIRTRYPRALGQPRHR